MKNHSPIIDNEFLIDYYLEKEKDPAVKYRLAFLNSLKELKDTGYGLEKGCDVFSIAIPTAYAWIRKWNDEGYNGIAAPFHESDQPRGRPPKLNDDDLEKLKEMLSKRSNWLTQEIRELIREKFGADLSLSQVGRIVRKLNMHFSKPYPHDYRRPSDAEEQLMSKLEEAYKGLKDKGLSREDIEIGFIDESSPQTTANTVRFWHFGHGDIVKNTSKYKSNTIGFYAIYGVSAIDFLSDSKKESIIAFLPQIREANRNYKAVIVVHDNFKSHLAKETQEKAQQLDITLVPLPPYSPDLNPIEQIWKTIKRAVSENFIYSADYLKYIISDKWSEESKILSYARRWMEEFTPWIEYRDLCF
jgi:transposase